MHKEKGCHEVHWPGNDGWVEVHFKGVESVRKDPQVIEENALETVDLLPGHAVDKIHGLGLSFHVGEQLPDSLKLLFVLALRESLKVSCSL